MFLNQSLSSKKNFENSFFLSLDRLRGLQLMAKEIANRNALGIHRSPSTGSSLDFVQYKEYVPGDSVHHIAWKLYGRTDKIYTKQFRHESNLPIYILLDNSKSMNYKSRASNFTKFEYATLLTLGISYIALKQRDPVGLLHMRPDASPKVLLADYVFARQFSYLSEEILKIQMVPKWDLIQQSRYFSSRFNRSVVIIFSDFLESVDMLKQAFQLLRRKKNIIIFMHVLDIQEKMFDFYGYVKFCSMEDNSVYAVNVDVVKDKYRERIGQFIQTCSSLFCRQDLIFSSFSTIDDPVMSLKQILRYTL